MPSSILKPPTPIQRANFRNLYFDVLWFGILAGSTVTFLAVYAARLGASSFQVGLLSAGPAMVNLIITLPASRWLESRPLIRSAFQGAVWNRLGYVVLIPLPLLLSEPAQVWGIALIVLVMSVAGAVLLISFNAMFADVVPPEWRAYVVGRRNAIVAISAAVSALICGQLLDMIIFPINYQIVFLIGAVGGMMSSYHVGRIRSAGNPPSVTGKPLEDLGLAGVSRLVGQFRQSPELRFLLRREGKPLLRLDVLRGPFGMFMLAYFMFYTFQYIPLPLFPIYYVNVLNLSDGAISLGMAIFNTLTMLASLQLSRVTARFGYRRVLVFNTLIFGQYCLLLALAHSATLFWIASMTGGIIWAMINGGLINRLMERVPENDRTAYMALHNMAFNLGILTGSLVGPVLTGWVGLREAIFISTGLRFLGGVLMWLWA